MLWPTKETTKLRCEMQAGHSRGSRGYICATEPLSGRCKKCCPRRRDCLQIVQNKTFTKQCTSSPGPGSVYAGAFQQPGMPAIPRSHAHELLEGLCECSD